MNDCGFTMIDGWSGNYMEKEPYLNCYIEDEDGDIIANPVCLDCKYSYIDNLFYELHCKKKECDKFVKNDSSTLNKVIKGAVMKNLSTDDIIEILKGIIVALLGIIFYILSCKLPEWMCGMLLVSAISLYTLYKIIG